jgi:ferric-dicitrate binding protein FerR (iron transport regulator)
VNDLHRKHSEHRADVNRRIDELSRGVEDRDAARESERSRQLGRRLRYEELGLLVFVGGVVLTTAGAIA